MFPFSDKVYQWLKWLAAIVFPALAALVGAVGIALNLHMLTSRLQSSLQSAHSSALWLARQRQLTTEQKTARQNDLQQKP
jgi:hypothetical protein